MCLGITTPNSAEDSPPLIAESDKLPTPARGVVSQCGVSETRAFGTSPYRSFLCSPHLATTTRCATSGQEATVAALLWRRHRATWRSTICVMYAATLDGHASSAGGEFEDRQAARGMHDGDPEPRIGGECGELGNAAFPATEVGEHAQVHSGAQ